MSVVEVGAAVPHIFGPPVFRNVLILNIGVCNVWRESARKKETAHQVSRIWISHFTVL
jgi:hypothetical protein